MQKQNVGSHENCLGEVDHVSKFHQQLQNICEIWKSQVSLQSCEIGLTNLFWDRGLKTFRILIASYQFVKIQTTVVFVALLLY